MNTQILSENISFCHLKYDQIEQAIILIYNANKNAYPHLVNHAITEEEFNQENRTILEKAFQAQNKINSITKLETRFVHALRMNQRLIAVMMSKDIKEEYEYMKPHFEENQYCSLFQHLKIQQLALGEVIYYGRLSVHPQYMGKGLGKRLVYEASRYLFEQGYRFSISGTLVNISFNLFKGLGGEILIYEKADRGHFYYDINILKNDLKQIIQIYESQKQKISK